MRRIIVLATVVIISFGSCSKERETRKVEHEKMGGHGMAVDWKFSLPQGDPAEGRKLFVEAECYKCHEIKGEKFPGVAQGEKGVGPELSEMAGMHPPEFFAESIINPNVVIDPKGKELGYVGDDGKSKMPDYSNILTVKQVADLASYIDSLKAHKSHEQAGH